MRTATLLALLIVWGCRFFTGTALATSHMNPYQTDAAAQTYLDHGLRKWAGRPIKHGGDNIVIAECVNGYYSKHETKTHRHFPQGHETKSGENTFRSFACNLTLNDHNYNLYVVATRRGWRVRADR